MCAFEMFAECRKVVWCEEKFALSERQSLFKTAQPGPKHGPNPVVKPQQPAQNLPRAWLILNWTTVKRPHRWFGGQRSALSRGKQGPSTRAPGTLPRDNP